MELHATRGGTGKTSSATGEVIPTDEVARARLVARPQPAYDAIVLDLPAGEPVPVDPALIDEIMRATDRADGR